jgi:hypothetical protein
VVRTTGDERTAEAADPAREVADSRYLGFRRFARRCGSSRRLLSFTKQRVLVAQGKDREAHFGTGVGRCGDVTRRRHRVLALLTPALVPGVVGRAFVPLQVPAQFFELGAVEGVELARFEAPPGAEMAECLGLSNGVGR